MCCCKRVQIILGRPYIYASYFENVSFLLPFSDDYLALYGRRELFMSDPVKEGAREHVSADNETIIIRQSMHVLGVETYPPVYLKGDFKLKVYSKSVT